MDKGGLSKILKVGLVASAIVFLPGCPHRRFYSPPPMIYTPPRTYHSPRRYHVPQRHYFSPQPNRRNYRRY